MVDQMHPPPTWAPPEAPPIGNRRQPLAGSLLAAGVILLVLGVLIALGGGFFLLTGALAAEMPAEFGLPAPPELATSFMVFIVAIGVLAVVAGVAHFVFGIGVLRMRGWARVGGLVVAVLGILITLVVAVLSLAPYIDPLTGQPYQLTVVDYALNAAITGASVAAYLFVILVLARRGREFI